MLYPSTELYLRSDSGFAVPKLYELLETNGTSYAIRLKFNNILHDKADFLTSELDIATKYNKVDFAVCYGEIMYQAGSWNQPRRVVIKVEKPMNQINYMYTFIVTNMDLKPEQLIKFYCNRGSMENFIKESKSGFDFDSMSSHDMVVNANRLQISMLAYNLFNWFRTIALPANMRKYRIDTIRLKLIKIASRVIHSAGYLIFKLCSFLLLPLPCTLQYQSGHPEISLRRILSLFYQVRLLCLIFIRQKRNRKTCVHQDTSHILCIASLDAITIFCLKPF